MAKSEVTERLDELVETTLQELAKLVQDTPLQSADRWHGKSAWARLLDGAFTLQRLAREEDER